MKVFVVFAILAVGIQSTYVTSPFEQDEKQAYALGVAKFNEFIQRGSQSVAELRNILGEFAAIQFGTENLQTQFLLGYASSSYQRFKQSTPPLYPLPLDSPNQDKGNPETQLDIAWKAGYNEGVAILASTKSLANFKALAENIFAKPYGPYGTVPDTSADLLSQLQYQYLSGISGAAAALNRGTIVKNHVPNFG